MEEIDAEALKVKAKHAPSEDAHSHSKVVDVKVDIPEKNMGSWSKRNHKTREFEQSKSGGNVWRIDSGREKTKTNLG